MELLNGLNVELKQGGKDESGSDHQRRSERIYE
jgi:hypothetical protein